MDAYDEDIENRFDLKYFNVDVDGRIIYEGKLLSIDMEYEQFIREYTRVIEDRYLKHSDELLHYENEEDKYFGMGLSIRHGGKATYEYATVKGISVGEDGHPVGTAQN